MDITSEQSHLRVRFSRADHLVEANSQLIMNWSLIQSIVIVFSAITQVYFIKNLFVSKYSKPKC